MKIALKRDTWNYIGMAIGVVAIIIGLVFLCHGETSLLWNGGIGIRGVSGKTFGADFYTEIYEATALAANAIVETHDMLHTCFSVIFMLLGAVDICAFGSKLSARKHKEIAELTPAKDNTIMNDN